MIFHRMRGLNKQSTTGRTRHRRRLGMLEGLEGRVLLTGSPTIYTVDLTSDTGAGSNNKGDLLYCITQANADPNTAGSDIRFDPAVFSASTPQTITLKVTLALTETAGPEVIDGPGASIVTISGNHAVEPFEINAHVTASLSGLTISQGQTNTQGGGIDSGGTLTVSDCAILNNSAPFGGGIYSNGTLTVTGNTTIENNAATASSGGGILNDGMTVMVTDSTIESNSAKLKGGGIANTEGGALAVAGAKISDNSAKLGGGLVNTAGSTATVSESTFSGDTATGTSSNAGGGGVYNSGGTASIAASTFAGNSAEGSGGGIFANGGALTIANSTVADNSVAGHVSLGGGIYADAGTLTAVNCTIAYNSEPTLDSASGGGMDLLNATVTLNNTIIALNTDGTGSGAAPDNLFFNGSGTVSTASANNLIGAGGGNSGLQIGSNGNQVQVANPGIGRLADNGGPTESIALLAGSPAIDAGSNALAVDPSNKLLLTTDQRGAGFPRIVNGTVDIGAFERPIVTASPTVYTVNLTSDTGAGSGNKGDLLYAINQANADTNLAGSVIEFDPTIFNTTTPQTITLGSTLELNEPSGPETIDGPGASALTISGNKAVQVFLVDSGLTASLSGLTISGGSAFDGAAIENDGTLTVTGVIVSGNSSRNKGAVDNDGSLTVTDSTIANNSASLGAGIFNQLGCTVTVMDSAITGNSAVNGGGIQNLGTLTVTGSTLSANVATSNAGQGGGGIYNVGKLSVTDSTFSGNSENASSGYGGGICDEGGSGSIAGTTFTGNSAYEGGGIYTSGGALTITGSILSNNSAGHEGGGIANLGLLTLSAGTISGNSAVEFGGGVFDNGGGLTITNSTLSSNSSEFAGGIYFESTGSLTLGDSTLSDNSATGDGGGIDSYGSITITDSSLSGNSASRYGGGIINAGTLLITASTLSGNSAGDEGGGLWNGGSASVTNTTFANNSAFYGGGILDDSNYPLTVVNGTIAYDSVVNDGGGLDISAGTVTLDNTIVALNTNGAGSSAVADDIYVFDAGNPTATLSATSAYNLIGTGGAGGLTNDTNGNQVGVANPGLATALAYNGAATQTIALLAGSKAIDQGRATITGATVPDTDERGFPRIGSNDVGAFQVDPVPTSVYVNAAWASDPAGTAITWTDGSMHYVGYDALGTVQAGVNAVAAGGRVNVAAGTYSEQVAITESLTLAAAGASGATIQAPASLTSGDELSIASGDVVSLSGLAVKGAGAAVGIGDNGGTLTATGVTVTGFSTGVAIKDEGAALITDSDLTGNHTGLAVGGSASDQSSATARDDNLSGNNLGVDNLESSVSVMATLNWWGSLHGPASSANPGGNGVPAGTNVDFSPWIGAYTNDSPPGEPGFQPTAITEYAVQSAPPPPPPPPPEPEQIIGVLPVFERKPKRKGKPVLAGFTLDFSAPLDPVAALDPVNYAIDTVTAKKVKKRVKRMLHPITNFTVSYTPGNLALALKLGSTQKFPTGGQITVLAGVTSASGGALEGTTAFAVSKGGKSIEPE